MEVKKNILIVGGQGFIGSHIVKKAVEENLQVTVLSLNKHDFPIQFSGQEKVEKLYADITSKSDLDIISNRKFNYVVNCSGYINHQLFEQGGRPLINQHLIGVLNLVEVLDRENLESFVQVGSSDEYGNQPSPLKEITREAAISPYSFGKASATHFLQMLNISENFPATIVRFFLVYGPGQNNQRFLPQIIKGCLKNESFPTSEGKQIRDFCYVADIVDGIFKIFNTLKAKGEVINLASGNQITIKSMIQKIQKLIGKGQPEFGKFPYRPGENMSLFADISKAKEILNWEPETKLEDGLELTINHYQNFLK